MHLRVVFEHLKYLSIFKPLPNTDINFDLIQINIQLLKLILIPYLNEGFNHL